MLLGIAFVVEDGTKGPKCVFRYPAPGDGTGGSVLKQEHLNEHLTDAQEALGGSSSSENREGSALRGSFWRFESTMFARLFRPSATLCGKIFELTIDEFHFISNPVQTDGGNITLFNLVLIVESQAKHCAGDPGPRAKPSLLMLRHAVAKITSALVHEQNLNMFVSREVTTLLRLTEDHTREKLQRHKDLKEAAASDEKGEQEKRKSEVVGAKGKAERANNRPNVSKPESGVQQSDSAVKAGREEKEKLTRVGQEGRSRSSSIHSLLDKAIECSTLARELKEIYNSLVSNSAFEVCFQGLVRVSLTLNDAAISRSVDSLRPYQTLLLYDESSVLADASITSSPSALLRFVELLAEKGPLLSFKDISLAIGEPLVEIFYMAAHLAYWGKGRIIDALSKHNIYRISPSAELHLKVLSDKFEELLSRFMEKDDNRRNLITLPRILALFSMASTAGLPRVLSDHLDTAKSVLNLDSFEFVEILVWLLQNCLLTQLHQYIMLIAPNRVREAPKVLRAGEVKAVHDATMHRSVSNTALSLQKDDDLGQSAPTMQDDIASSGEVQPSGIISHTHRNEVAYIQRVATDSTMYHFLKTLRPYFHGKHHMEEIMWRNNISRETLNTVIQTYSDVLVPFLR